MTVRLFRNLRLFDGVANGLVQNAAVLVEGNQIRAIGAEDAIVVTGNEPHTTVDLGGRSVLPGLMNLHEHITWRRARGSFAETTVSRSVGELLVRGAGHAIVSLMEGVTTIRDCASKDGSALVLRDAIDRGEAIGPRIHSVGSAIAMTGGHGTGAVINADGPDEIRKVVRQQLHMGADWVKLMASGGYMLAGIDQPTSQQFSLEEMQAAFDEVHRAGMHAMVHVHPPQAIKAAVEAGADCVEHVGLADEASVELLAHHGTFVDPTLCSPRYDVEEADRLGYSDWLIEACRAHMEEQAQIFSWLHQAKCKIVTGTDASGSVQDEVRYMVELGMSPYEAIRAATAVAAECLGVANQLGTLAVGKLADFVVVDGDPLADVNALRHIFLTVKDGELYWPEVLHAAVGPSIVREFDPTSGSDPRARLRVASA